MGKRAKKSSPPAVGETFAMRLEDGRYGACRAVRGPLAHEQRHAAGHVVVAATAYLGDAPPPIDHPDLRRLLVLNHHSHKNEVACLWLREPPPPGDTFMRIGVIEPERAEQKLPCNSWSGWGWLSTQVRMQWRWDHERDAVLAEDAVRLEQIEQRRDELEQQRRDELARMTYASFRKQKLFKDWTGYPPKKMIAASRKLMLETASKLESLGPNPDRAASRAILRDCILAFNELDDANGNWIETVEREDICQHFDQLAHLAGFDEEPQLADEWRDW